VVERPGYESHDTGERVALSGRVGERGVRGLTAIAGLDPQARTVRVSHLDLVEKASASALADRWLSSEDQRRMGYRLVHHPRRAG